MELWTGIACLVADPRCKDFKRFGSDGKGAYVNIVAWATSEEEFRNRIRLTSESLDCILEELDRVQLLTARLEEPDFPEELVDMQSTAQRQRNDVVFGAFHTWTQGDN